MMRTLALTTVLLISAAAWGADPAKVIDEQSHAIAKDVATTVGLPVPDSFASRGGDMLKVWYASASEEAPAPTRFAAATYQLTKAAIGQRRPQIDRPSRWLVEGLSYCLVEDVVRQYLGDTTAEAMVEQFDAERHGSLRATSNLAYWVPGPDAMPPLNGHEQALAAARLAFAYNEAQRLVADHGVDVIGQILGPSDQPTVLDEATQVTGADLRQRLSFYQPFDSVGQGLREEVASLQAARNARQYDAAISHALRMMEIADDYSPKRIALIADLLHETDRDDDAIALLIQRARLADTPDQREALLSILIQRADGWGRVEVAYDAAEQLLATRPNHTGALAIRMRRQLAAGKLVQAKVTAGRIVAIEPRHEQAQRVIAQVTASVGLPQ